jgi:hypothetical protein
VSGGSKSQPATHSYLVGAVLREGQRMILHPRAPAHVAKDQHRHMEVALDHPVERNE